DTSPTNPDVGGGTLDRVTMADFVDRYVGAICGELQEGCASANVAFDSASCVTSMTREGQAQLHSSAPQRTYDEVNAAACIAKLRDTLATCALGPSFRDDV